MPIPEGPGQIPGWNYSGGGRGDDLLRYVDERLRALEYYLQRVTRALNHGPIAGAYFPATMRVYDDGSVLTPPLEGTSLLLNFNAAPHYLAATCRPSGSHVTLQLTDGTTDYLMTPLDTSVAEPWVNERSGFITPATFPKPVELRLRVDSIVAGSPVEVTAILVCAHVQKVDDPQV